MPEYEDTDMFKRDEYVFEENSNQKEDIDKEEIPLNNTEVDCETQKNEDLEKKDFSAKRSLKWLIANDKEYQHKLFRTVCLSWSFIAFGWTMGQTGPSFLDLKVITDSTLEKAAAFLTAGSVGYLTGSLISGFLHNKIHGDLLLFLCVCLNVVMTAVIPWCFIYETMIAAMFVRHTFLGAWDTVGNAELIQIWGDENMSYMQALHFCFAFGGILSPIATAPFLITPQEDNAVNVTSENLTDSTTFSSMTATPSKQIVSYNSMVNTDIQNFTDSIYNTTIIIGPNSTNMTSEVNKEPRSRLYLAYIITSCIALTAAVLFLISYIISRRRRAIKHKGSEEDIASRKLPLFSKIIILVNLMFLMGLYVAVEETTMGFLTTFCVEQFHWSKQSGSYATSAFWAAFAFGRFLGIFVIRRCSPSRMISTYILLLIASFTGLLLTSSLNVSVGVWIFIPISGFAMSVIFATVFTWTESELLPVTGKISSLFLIAASTGGMVNPLAVASLMDSVTPMYFCYLLLGESVVLLCLYFLASLLAKRMDRLFGKLNNTERCVDAPLAIEKEMCINTEEKS